MQLLKKANGGEIELHIPGICLSEAPKPMRAKFQPRRHADAIRGYLRRAKEEDKLSAETDSLFRQTLDRYEADVSNDLERLEESIATLRKEKGVDVFPLSEQMLEKGLALGPESLDLKLFDNAILAATLVRAGELKKADATAELYFCELDGDLQPWDSNGKIKPALAKLYDDARIWVYGDFSMTSPARPETWLR
ncbi:MAG TPA: hypothetical protein VGR55_15710 [Candidatus Acidoferrum sp.]|nr:hypothetical protein [Candidatus Acidoferrum sp.]